MKPNLKVALHNLGCKVNSYELENIKKELLKDGMEIVPFQDYADVYVINTCTVTNIADRKTRQMIHRARALNKKAVICAIGCYVDKDFPPDPDINLAVGNSEKGDFVKILNRFLSDNDPGANDVYHPAVSYESHPAAKTPGHTRAFLKIQDGCNQFCSYCIIPYVRGRIKSRPVPEILDEARALALEGFKELVLTGIHISSFGKDTHTPPAGSIFCYDRLLELIDSIAEIPGIERIRLGSLEPRIINESFVVGLKEIDKVCPHFHISLQSGSDSVLKRMNRHYTAGEYYDKTELLRKYFEEPFISTDIIVGFPGESEEEFLETLAFAKKIRLSSAHIFKYSKRDKTPAAAAPDQIPESLKGERSKRLMSITDATERDYLSSHTGKPLSVLFEEPVTLNGIRYMQGHSPEYIHVLYETELELSNTIVEVIPTSVSEDGKSLYCC